jgi:hypothetical protein
MGGQSHDNLDLYWSADLEVSIYLAFRRRFSTWRYSLSKTPQEESVPRRRFRRAAVSMIDWRTMVKLQALPC